VSVEPKDNLFGMIWMLHNFYIHSYVCLIASILW